MATASVTMMKDDVTMFNLYIVCNSNLHEKTPIMKQGAQHIATLAGNTVRKFTVEPLNDFHHATSVKHHEAIRTWRFETDPRVRGGTPAMCGIESRCSEDVSRRWNFIPLVGVLSAPTKKTLETFVHGHAIRCSDLETTTTDAV